MDGNLGLWNTTEQRCRQTLEPDDLEQVESCSSVDDLRIKLESLQHGCTDLQAVSMLSVARHPVTDLERLCSMFVDEDGKARDAPTLWGMLLLLAQVGCPCAYCR